ncbi:hypothetical protein Plhal304r1_c003g0010321 [Plasmopara halstedii]
MYISISFTLCFYIVALCFGGVQNRSTSRFLIIFPCGHFDFYILVTVTPGRWKDRRDQSRISRYLQDLICRAVDR